MSRPDHPGFDPYRVLQVHPEADAEVIQAVYRRLARKYHPDVAGDAAAAARMIEINAAFEIVGDAQRRAAYDRERARQDTLSTGSVTGAGQAPRSAPSSPASGAAARSPADSGSAARATPGEAGPQATRPPETVSRDWTTGRSSIGGGYDPSRMRTADGQGAAGPPPGNPSGTVLNFGRYRGWSLGEIGRTDLEYLEWLDRMAIGRAYRDEIDQILRRAGRRRSAPVQEQQRGLFRRR